MKRAIEIIENNIDIADFTGPVSCQMILKAEQLLDLNIPRSYLEFLTKYGAGDISGIEIFGIIEDPDTDRPMIPNGIWLTQNLRKEADLPDKYVVVSETGYGPYYIIDTSIKNEDSESPIYVWDENNQKEKAFDSFEEFVVTVLTESI